ncbi:MAG: hypothetical protein HY748_08995 [Elusimicrobia bacterium]|nr:hypothetical protein [Elusimicrobiota bacterium]
MKPLTTVLSFLLAVGQVAGQQLPPPAPEGCPDERAWSHVKSTYPDPAKPDPAAFIKLEVQERKKICDAAAAALIQQDAQGIISEIGVKTQLDGAGNKVGKIKDPFGPAAKSENTATHPKQTAQPKQTVSDPKEPSRPQSAMKASEFKPQLTFKPGVVPKPAQKEPEPRVLSIQDGSRELIDRFGDPREALWKVITARGGDDGESVSPEDQRKAWKDINAIVGGLKDPALLKKGEVDDRLRDFDHFLNAWGGAVGDGILRPNEDDGFFKGRGKVLGRTTMGVGATVVTAGYTGVKWIDQTLGTPFGKWIGGYDFNSEKCSKASFNEAWQGVKGVWYGVYTMDYGARPQTGRAVLTGVAGKAAKSWTKK